MGTVRGADSVVEGAIRPASHPLLTPLRTRYSDAHVQDAVNDRAPRVVNRNSIVCYQILHRIGPSGRRFHGGVGFKQPGKRLHDNECAQNPWSE